MDNNAVPADEIRAIVASLREEIARHRPPNTAEDQAVPVDPMERVRRHQWVNPHLPIGWPAMPRGFVPRLRTYAQKVVRRLLRWYINPLIDQQNLYNVAVADALATLVADSQRLTAGLGRLEAIGSADRLAVLEQRVDHLGARAEAESVRLEEAARSFESWHRALEEALAEESRRRGQESEVARLRLQRLENWQRQGRNSPERPDSDEPLAQPDFDCYLLGIRYRGEEQLTERLQDYDDLFGVLAEAQGRGERERKPVLDIGCGRGDLVVHLQELGLPAYGIELDEDTIRLAQDAGREVQAAEACSHLQGLPDGSLAAITLIQVIEHLGFGELSSLLSLAAAKIEPGGFIVAETINPLCLYALVNFYLLDPSHRAPLPPRLTEFMMEQAGLWRCETRYLRPVPDGARLETVQSQDQALAGPLNRNIQRLNDLVYGAQDYALIAYRPTE